jgi:hypothetical protein
MEFEGLPWHLVACPPNTEFAKNVAGMIINSIQEHDMMFEGVLFVTV